MKTRCLVPVHRSTNSLKAVDYVAKNINHDTAVTLFSVLSDPTPACDLVSLTPLFQEDMKKSCKDEEVETAAVEGFMDEAKKTLLKAGFPSKNVATRARKKRRGIAKDILKEANQGNYDTVVIGRRRLSGFKKLFTSSVSGEVLGQAKDVSVVVVD